jgi:hypothetical protein
LGRKDGASLFQGAGLRNLAKWAIPILQFIFQTLSANKEFTLTFLTSNLVTVHLVPLAIALGATWAAANHCAKLDEELFVLGNLKSEIMPVPVVFDGRLNAVGFEKRKSLLECAAAFNWTTGS